MIPLYHDFTGEVVLVFGGGTVGARKASRFAEEARVVVVSPDFADRLVESGLEIDETAAVEGDTEQTTVDTEQTTVDTEQTTVDTEQPAIQLVRAAPDINAVRDWIDRLSPALVVAATDDAAVNAAVEATALSEGILVNRTDVAGDRDVGSVVVPATINDDPVSVAVSTGGASPALSKALRERIESEIEGAGPMAELSGELRTELKDRDVAPEKRREAIRRVVRSDEVWKALQKGGSYPVQEADSVIEEVLNR